MSFGSEPMTATQLIQFVQSLFTSLDTDRSGYLDQYESKQLFIGLNNGTFDKEQFQSFLQSLDKNKDNKIDLNELTSFFIKSAQTKGFLKADDSKSPFGKAVTKYELQDVIKQIFDELDSDKSGQLEKSETRMFFIKIQGSKGFDEALFEKTFKSMDQSGDGQVDCKELTNFFVSMARKNYWLIEDNANVSPFGGKKISERELGQIVMTIFQQLDSDGSGNLEKPEVHVLYQKMFNKGGRMTVESEKEFEKMFALMDTSGDGNVDCNELIAFFVKYSRDQGWIEEREGFKFGQSVTQADIVETTKEMFIRLDVDKSGELSKNEVRELYLQVLKGLSKADFNEENFNKAFLSMDKSGDGLIDLDELTYFFVKLARQLGVLQRFEDEDSYDEEDEDEDFVGLFDDNKSPKDKAKEEKKGKKASKKLTEYTQRMIHFIPATILHQLIQNDDMKQQSSGEIKVPLCHRTNSVVLVAELRNFYDVTKIINGEYPDEQAYNEHLWGLSHNFLLVMSSTLNKFSGDLIQFTGTSLIAIWPPSGNKQDQCRQAAQCAIEILKVAKTLLQIRGVKVESDKSEPNDVELQLCFGLGYGDIQVLHMGGILKRVEFFVSGNALQNALNALSVTSSKDSIAVGGDFWEAIKENISGHIYVPPAILLPSLIRPGFHNLKKFDEGKDNESKFYFVEQSKKQTRLSRESYLQKDKIDEIKIQRLQLQLKSYIPGAYKHLSQIKQEQSRYGQHIKGTVLALAIEMQTDFKNEKADKTNLKFVQSIVQIVQAQIYKMEGSIIRFFAYQSFILVIAAWGLQYLSHQDDCARAVFAAFNIKKELIAFQQDSEIEDDSFVEPPVHIGIATGNIFQGFVGNNVRREIVLLGEVVDRALLLLQTAQTKYGKIYCDFETKMKASHYVDFRYIEHLEFTHSVTNEALFSPMFDDEDDVEEEKKVLVKAERIDDDEAPELKRNRQQAKSQASSIQIHANPFFCDKENKYQNEFCEAYGRYEKIDRVISDIEEYIQDLNSNGIWLLAVRGPSGSGKSLFTRRLILEIAEREKIMFKPLYKINPTYHFDYFVMSATANNRLQFIGVWRPFLQHLLYIYSIHTKQSKEFLINSMISRQRVDGQVQIFEEIFNLKNLGRGNIQSSSKLQEDKLMAATSFSNQSFQKDFEEMLLVFCCDFVKIVVQGLKSFLCFFLLLDNGCFMNVSSWKLFKMIEAEVDYMVLITNMESDSRFFDTKPELKTSLLNFAIDEDNEITKFYREKIKPEEEEMFNIVDMNPLEKDTIKQALIDLSPVYEKTKNNDIEDSTKMYDPQHRLKTFGGQKAIQLRLVSQHQVYQSFEKVDDDVMDQIYIQSFGNPLVAFEFTYQCVIQGFVSVEKQNLISATKFRNAVRQQSWTLLQLPYILFKRNCVLLETAIKSNKYGLQTLQTVAVVQLIQQLQTASVIGDRFSSDMLGFSNQCLVDKHKVIQNTDLLKEIESRDIIEMIYSDELSDKQVYRFTQPFMRSTLYQMQGFISQKKQTHEHIRQFMQENSIFDYTTDYNLDKEMLMMLRHLTTAEKVQNEDNLSGKSRQALQTKKISQKLQEKKGHVKTGTIKVSLDAGKTSEKVFMILTSKILEIFQQVENFSGKTKNVPYALINLGQIAKVKAPKLFGNIFSSLPPADVEAEAQKLGGDKKQFYFKITVNRWDKFDRVYRAQAKDKIRFIQLENSRKFKREAEDWMTAIEYVRTKINIDNFVSHFGKVSDGSETKIQVANYHDRFSNQFILGHQKIQQERQQNNQGQIVTEFGDNSKTNAINMRTSIIKKTQEKHEFSRIKDLVNVLGVLYNVSLVSFARHLQVQGGQNLGQIENLDICMPLKKVIGTVVLDETDNDSKSESSHQSKFAVEEPFINNSSPETAAEPVRKKSLCGVGQSMFKNAQNLASKFENNTVVVPEVFEEHQMDGVSMVKDHWEEGDSFGFVIKSQQVDMPDKTNVFKLRRRWDKQGYNDLLSPYKENDNFDQGSSQMPIHKQSSKVRRTAKAFAIQKILENSTIISHHIPDTRQGKLSQQVKIQTDIASPMNIHIPSPAIQESVQSQMSQYLKVPVARSKQNSNELQQQSAKVQTSLAEQTLLSYQTARIPEVSSQERGSSGANQTLRNVSDVYTFKQTQVSNYSHIVTEQPPKQAQFNNYLDMKVKKIEKVSSSHSELQKPQVNAFLMPERLGLGMGIGVQGGSGVTSHRSSLKKTKQDEIQSRQGDNELVQSESQHEISDLSSSDDATFSDYQLILKEKPRQQFRTPELGNKHASPYIEVKSSSYQTTEDYQETTIGFPAIVSNEKVQCLSVRGGTKVKLAKGEIVYLSQHWEQNNNQIIIQCHAWKDGERVDIIVRKADLALIQEENQDYMMSVKSAQNVMLSGKHSRVVLTDKPSSAMLSGKPSSVQLTEKNSIVLTDLVLSKLQMRQLKREQAQTVSKVVQMVDQSKSTTVDNQSSAVPGLKANERIKQRRLNNLI